MYFCNRYIYAFFSAEKGYVLYNHVSVAILCGLFTNGCSWTLACYAILMTWNLTFLLMINSGDKDIFYFYLNYTEPRTILVDS